VAIKLLAQIHGKIKNKFLKLAINKNKFIYCTLNFNLYTRLMTDTKIKLSIPEMLLHLVLLTAVFWFSAGILRSIIGDENDTQILVNIILFVEVTLTFYFIPLKHPLKINKSGFVLTVLFSSLNAFVVFISLLLTIDIVTPYPHSPYYEYLNNLMPFFLAFPLLTYLSGFIDKKHFYTLAAIIFISFIIAVTLLLSLEYLSEIYVYSAWQDQSAKPVIHY